MKECPVCHGDGEIEDFIDYDHNGDPIADYMVCFECKGTGKSPANLIEEDINR